MYRLCLKFLIEIKIIIPTQNNIPPTLPPPPTSPLTSHTNHHINFQYCSTEPPINKVISSTNATSILDHHQNYHFHHHRHYFLSPNLQNYHYKNGYHHRFTDTNIYLFYSTWSLLVYEDFR